MAVNKFNFDNMEAFHKEETGIMLFALALVRLKDFAPPVVGFASP